MTYIFIAILVAYILLITAYTVAWQKTPVFEKRNTIEDTMVSVIIIARNEELNIANVLDDIVKQTYNKEMFECIVADDSSTDSTFNIIENYAKRYDFLKPFQVPSNINGKKQAIKLAVEKAQGTLILTTDADCRLGSNWIKTFVSFYQHTHAKMICGLVQYTKEKTFFEKLQSLEFLSLIVSGAAAIELEKPIMCNGANLGYEKQAFDDVKGYDNDKLASGDDVFLLFKIHTHFGNKSVCFLKNADAVVATYAHKSINAFFNQRIRWASKAKAYTNVFAFSTALLILLTNIVILTLVVLSFFNYKNAILAYVFIFVKMLVDFPILYFITSFLKKESLLDKYLLLQILYPFYIVTTGILSLFVKVQWKGRKIE